MVSSIGSNQFQPDLPQNEDVTVKIRREMWLLLSCGDSSTINRVIQNRDFCNQFFQIKERWDAITATGDEGNKAREEVKNDIRGLIAEYSQ